MTYLIAALLAIYGIILGIEEAIRLWVIRKTSR